MKERLQVGYVYPFIFEDVCATKGILTAFTNDSADASNSSPFKMQRD